MSITRRSSLLSRNVRASQSASVPPICTAVPTLAMDPPKSNVTTGDRKLSGAMRSGTSWRFKCTSSMSRLLPRSAGPPTRENSR